MPVPLLGLLPSELYSSRAAVRCLQRLCPHAVGPAADLSDPKLVSAAINLGSNDVFELLAKWREQATFPDFRVLLHARVRYGQRRFRPRHARSSLGLLPLQGVLSRRDDTTSAGYSPHVVSRSGAEAPHTTPPQGINLNEQGWSLSRLPTLLGFPTS